MLGLRRGLVEEVVLLLTWRDEWAFTSEGRTRTACSKQTRCHRPRDQAAPAQSPVLADLKIPASIFSFPLGLLPFFSPSFLVSSFLDGPFWQPLDSFAHPPQGASYWLGGPKPCWAPCCSGTGWRWIQRPPSTHFSQMPINRCQKRWLGQRPMSA